MDPDVEVAIAPTGRFTAGRLDRHWYVGCLSQELRRRPLARTVLDLPLVLFRDRHGAPAALLDRCPHRNVPLSAGRCLDGEIECGYHGWRFATAGTEATRVAPRSTTESRPGTSTQVPSVAKRQPW